MSSFQENEIDSSSDCFREQLEYLSLEKSSESDETSDNVEQDIIEEETEETKRSISPSNSFIKSITTLQDINISNSKLNESNDSNDSSSNYKIFRAINTIAFFRALNGGYFNNIDPSYFAVISDGQLIGIYESEEKACQVASQTNHNIGNQVGDGKVFPISGNFKRNPITNGILL